VAKIWRSKKIRSTHKKYEEKTKLWYPQKLISLIKQTNQE
jgi:hypothetical protein